MRKYLKSPALSYIVIIFYALFFGFIFLEENLWIHGPTSGNGLGFSRDFIVNLGKRRVSFKQNRLNRVLKMKESTKTLPIFTRFANWLLPATMGLLLIGIGQGRTRSLSFSFVFLESIPFKEDLP